MPYRKDKRITKIGFAFPEWETVCLRSSALGMRVGTYIRTISVQGSIKVFKLKELNDVYRAMNRIGININQIAKVVNRTGSVYQKDMEDIQKEIKELRIIMEDWLSPLEPEEIL